MICARWTLKRSNPLLVFIGFPPSFGLSIFFFFLSEHDGIFSSNPPWNCTLQDGRQRCKPYINRIPIALPSRAWQSRILYGWCQIYLLTHVPVCVSLPGWDLLNIWRRSEATGALNGSLLFQHTPLPHNLPFLLPSILSLQAGLPLVIRRANDRALTPAASETLLPHIMRQWRRKEQARLCVQVSVGSLGFGRRPRSMWPKFKLRIRGLSVGKDTLQMSSGSVGSPGTPGEPGSPSSPHPPDLISSKWATRL